MPGDSNWEYMQVTDKIFCLWVIHSPITDFLFLIFFRMGEGEECSIVILRRSLTDLSSYNYCRLWNQDMCRVPRKYQTCKERCTGYHSILQATWPIYSRSLLLSVNMSHKGKLSSILFSMITIFCRTILNKWQEKQGWRINDGEKAGFSWAARRMGLPSSPLFSRLRFATLLVCHCARNTPATWVMASRTRMEMG